MIRCQQITLPFTYVVVSSFTNPEAFIRKSSNAAHSTPHIVHYADTGRGRWKSCSKQMGGSVFVSANIF